jgi:hypothetical protein
MPAPFVLGGQWGRIAPTLTVLGVTAVAALALLPPMYAVGKRHDDERVFLRNYRAPNEFEAFASYPMNYATLSQEDNDVIFVGDSGLRCGVRTTEFERETGLKGYNLGNQGLIGIVGQTQIINSYLVHHPKPRLIVVCILPSELTPGDLKYWPQEERDVRSRFLWCYGPGTEDMRPHNSFLYHTQVGFKYTYGLLVGGFDRFANEPVPCRGGETYRTLQDVVTKERGYWEPPARRKAFTAARGQATGRDPFRVSDEFMKDFSKLLRLLADHGIPVLIRFAPWLYSTSDYSPTIRAWAEELESKNPQVVVARPEVLVYHPSLFHDAGHLNGEGADEFTRLVSEEVRQVLGKQQDSRSTRAFW